MSLSYRLLGEGMPEPAGLGMATFPADARKTAQWVAALPRANAAATQQSLAWALDSLSAQRLDGSHRLAILEQLRPVIAESIGLLKRQYAGSALPLAAAKAMAAQQVEAFHLALAHAYRQAAVEFCAPAGKIPMFRGNSVATALARSAWNYSQALAVAWRVYRAPARGVWQGLHRVHRFAAERQMDTKHDRGSGRRRLGRSALAVPAGIADGHHAPACLQPGGAGRAVAVARRVSPDAARCCARLPSSIRRWCPRMPTTALVRACRAKRIRNGSTWRRSARKSTPRWPADMTVFPSSGQSAATRSGCRWRCCIDSSVPSAWPRRARTSAWPPATGCALSSG